MKIGNIFNAIEIIEGKKKKTEFVVFVSCFDEGRALFAATLVQKKKRKKKFQVECRIFRSTSVEFTDDEHVSNINFRDG